MAIANTKLNFMSNLAHRQSFTNLAQVNEDMFTANDVTPGNIFTAQNSAKARKRN